MLRPCESNAKVSGSTMLTFRALSEKNNCFSLLPLQYLPDRADTPLRFSRLPRVVNDRYRLK